jgi:hypothetical protein
LDFAYSQGRVLDKFDTVETLVGGLHVADYLDMPLLREKLEDLVKDAFCPTENAHHFYECAAGLRQDRLTNFLDEEMTSKIKEIQPNAEAIKVLTVPSMLEIISSEKYLVEHKCDVHSKMAMLVIAEETSRHLSKLVSSFIESHEDLTAEDFQALTNVEWLPIIDKGVSLKLIELKGKFYDAIKSCEDNPIEKRCYQAIQQELLDLQLDDTKRNEILDFIQSHPTEHAVDMLVNYVKEAGIGKKQEAQEAETQESLEL